MNTDKEIYLILTRCPEFISELSGLPSYGKSEVKSVNLKAINRTADGVEFPADPESPIRVFEAMQGIYRRSFSAKSKSIRPGVKPGPVACEEQDGANCEPFATCATT